MNELAEFCANLAIAWLASGIIAPIFTGRIILDVVKTGMVAFAWTGFLIIYSLYLLKGVR